MRICGRYGSYSTWGLRLPFVRHFDVVVWLSLSLYASQIITSPDVNLKISVNVNSFCKSFRWISRKITSLPRFQFKNCLLPVRLEDLYIPRSNEAINNKHQKTTQLGASKDYSIIEGRKIITQSFLSTELLGQPLLLLSRHFCSLDISPQDKIPYTFFFDVLLRCAEKYLHGC